MVVTDGVQDVAGHPIQRSTLADILFGFTNPPVDANGKSQLPGRLRRRRARAHGGADRAHAHPRQHRPAHRLHNAHEGERGPRLHRLDADGDRYEREALGAALRSQRRRQPGGQRGVHPGAPVGFDPATIGIPAATQTALLPPVDSFIIAPFATVDAINPATGAFRPGPGHLGADRDPDAGRGPEGRDTAPRPRPASCRSSSGTTASRAGRTRC